MIGFYLPPTPPNVETFIEYRILIPQHTFSMNDNVLTLETKFINPEIPNPFYYEKIWTYTLETSSYVKRT